VEKSTFKVEKIDLNAGHTVGYGSKDHAIFPLFCVLAGLYGNGRPVRLANDRFEQFQMGLKRHAYWMKNTLVVDKATGKFKIMKGEFKNDGGGRGNYSFSVAMVGATAAQSIYYFPKSDYSAAALASRAVEAGSMRGYGTLQTMSATEMMVDEAAELLKMDPIDLRLRNVLRAGMKNTQGAIPASTIRNEEILLKARSHALWTGRQARKVKFDAENNGKKYGVGFAQVQKNYGGGAEGIIATIEFDPQGKLTLRHIVHEIGTGATTSQAMIVGNVLGRVPDRTEYSVVEWPEMPLTSTEQPYTTPQEKEDELKKDPRWTPRFTVAMYASNSVYFFGHATREASQALLRMSLWPAAQAIWSDASGVQAKAVRFEDLRVSNGTLSAGGLEPLAFERIAAKAHEMGMITGVSVHAFNRWQWAEAEFEVPGVGRMRMPIDALALKYGEGASAERKALMTSGGFHFIERSSVSYPPTELNNVGATYYASIATLAEVAVDPSTGKVQLLSHHSILDCGPPVVPQLVSGQIQGGLAMGIGHALHEYLPLYEDGPGNGTWNFHRYKLPLASDVAVWTQTAELLPPLSEDEPPKGIAELTMIAIVPAIANAVANATGKRFYEFPISPAKIRGARS
jgi:CO/xanthine dehydrogenase Mo-binding subunit